MWEKILAAAIVLAALWAGAYSWMSHLAEEPDAVTGKDRWVIYDFALGKW